MKIRSLLGNLTKRLSKNPCGLRPSISQFNFSNLQNDKSTNINSLFNSTQNNFISNFELRRIVKREYTEKRSREPYDQSKHKKKVLLAKEPRGAL